MKPKNCPICSDQYFSMRVGQKTCPKPACAIAFMKAHPEKAAKVLKAVNGLQRRARSKQKREGRESLMTTKDWLKRAKTALHAYIRARDIKAGYNCICCDEPFEPNKPGGTIDAGHFRSVGSAKHMEFVEMNIHAQRKGCNRSGQNRYEAYKKGLIARIGLEAVEALERDQEPRQLRICDFQEIERTYKAKLKELQA